MCYHICDLIAPGTSLISTVPKNPSNQQPLHLIVRQLLDHVISKLHSSLRHSFVLVLGLISTQLIGDDFLGTYRTYDVDQETGEISEMEEGLSTSISIVKEDDGTYTVVITREVSKEQWEKSHALLREMLEGMSPEAKKNWEQFAGIILIGDKPSDTEGLFDAVMEHNLNEVQSYENVKKQIETTKDVTVEGNKVAIFFPFPDDADSYEGTTKDEKEAGDYYEIVIEEGELNGTFSDYYGPDLKSSTKKIHAKRVSDSPRSEEESYDTKTEVPEDPTRRS